MIGLVTTSWPSQRLPYAGHFVAAMAGALVRSGHQVTVVAPAFEGDGGLLTAPDVALIAPAVAGQAGRLARSAARWLPTVAALRRGVRQVDSAQGWIAHWWPTLTALPRSKRTAVALHGSDVDLLERLPRPFALATSRWVAKRATVVGVAPHLARRFDALHGSPVARVCPLGADPPSDLTPPPVAASWLNSGQPRILTVARDAPGKGLGVARSAASRSPELAWLILDGNPPLTPREVWALIQTADLVVVPSEQGPGLPAEGKPHIIAQALACGTPVLGGPNAAVREALSAVGQPTVAHAGPTALAAAVARSLRHRHDHATRALAAGKQLRWLRVITAWTDALALGA